MEETQVAVTCPDHGRRTIRASEITLRVFDHENFPDYYLFTCEDCGTYRTKPAGKDVAVVLAPFVKIEKWHVPLELLEDRSGPRLTESDYFDFAAELYRQESIRMPR